jgi:hypothetical protein
MKVDLNISHEAMAGTSPSFRHDVENLRLPPSTQLYHFPWTVPTLKIGTRV